MANFTSSDVKECEALHRSGTIVSMDAVNVLVDVQVDGVTYEGIEIHYHCLGSWEDSSHPHSSEEKVAMLAAFDVNDEVLVLCDENGYPLYVIGFLGSPRSCNPIIVLFSKTGDDYDWWYWDLLLNEGYHENPSVEFPSSPEIITKWWSCEGLEVVEFYTRATPAFSPISSGGCGDSCGLVTFDNGVCCDLAAGQPNDIGSWKTFPCGGVDAGTCWFSGRQIACSKKNISCSGCGNGTQTLYFPGCAGSMSRSSIQSANCPVGYAWYITVGGLTEKINIGPRTNSGGHESSSICTISGAKCAPIESHNFCCPVCSPDGCSCTWMWLPAHCGQQCGGESCEGWGPVEGGGWTKCRNRVFQGMDTYGAQYGSLAQGCITYTVRTRSGSGYSLNTVPLSTIITVGEKETSFDGSWQEYISQSASEGIGNYIDGWSGNCITCGVGAVIIPPVITAQSTYSEISYGIDGWRTVVTADGRFAVLLPRLEVSANGASPGGGSIIGTTTAILRIVDDGETSFTLAAAAESDGLSGLAASREDLGIRPNCWPREGFPFDIGLRGFHWHETYNKILSAFVLDGEFFASLLENIDNVWTEDQLTAFRSWVDTMGIIGYTMFLR